MAYKLDINSREIVALTNKLEKMHRSVLPVSVRESLNEAAFLTKRIIPEVADEVFIIRSKSFFRAFSRVQRATGFKVNKFEAIVGMVDAKPGGRSEQAGRNMTQRQKGGRIGGRTFIPLPTARAGKNSKRNVRRNLRLRDLNSQLDKMVDTNINKGKTRRQRFIKSAIYAVKRFGPKVLIKHKGQDGTTRVFLVEKRGAAIKTREFNITVTPIYTFEEGRSVNAGKVVPFTEIAARRIGKDMLRIFVKQAEKRVNKIKSR